MMNILKQHLVEDARPIAFYNRDQFLFFYSFYATKNSRNRGAAGFMAAISKRA